MGLSRRELVADQRGKVPIPESDLWVLAGSCGVDVGELVPEHRVLALEAGPDSIGDTIAFLRRNQDTGNGRAVLALEAADAATPFYSGPQPAAAPPAEPFVSEPFVPEAFAPEPFVRASFANVGEPTTAAPVDVFEELARLPEPVPLTSEPDDYPDMLAPPVFLTADATHEQSSIESTLIETTMADPAFAPPAGTYELVDDQPFAIPPAGSVGDVATTEFVGFDSPTVVDAAPTSSTGPGLPRTRRRSTSHSAARPSPTRRGRPTCSPTRRRGRPPTGSARPPACGTSPTRGPDRRHGRTTMPTTCPTCGEPATRLTTAPFEDEVATDDVMGAEDTGADLVGAELLADSRALNSRDRARLTRRSR